MARKKTTEEFIKDAKRVHGDKYDYSKSVYINAHTKLIIICKEHGEFLSSPNNHTTKRAECFKCSYIKRTTNQPKTKEDFIKEANEVHDNKYDYSKFEYIRSDVNGVIICEEHGEFEQCPSSHLIGQECPICAIDKRKQTNLKRYGSISPFGSKEVQEKTKKTNNKKYGCNNVFQSEEIKEKSKKTLLRKYGVEHPLQNGKLFEKALNTSFQFKEHITPSGKTIKLQGYEPQGYTLLLEEYKEEDIVHKRSEVPKIWYYLEDESKHRYYPDFFISKDNLIVEVKSQYTYEKELDKNLLKQQACIDNGYDFKFMILEG